jgi:hypothetical protein
MTDQVVPTEMSLVDKLEFERQSQKSRSFLAKHPEYFNSPENNSMLGAEIQRLGRDWTVDSLEIAYANLKDKLAQRPAPPETEPEDNLGFTMASINALSGRELIELRKNDESRRAIDRVIAKYNASKVGKK